MKQTILNKARHLNEPNIPLPYVVVFMPERGSRIEGVLGLVVFHVTRPT